MTRWGGAANTANLIQPFNVALRDSVQDLKAMGRPVELVDAFEEIGNEHLVDGVHLTQVRAREMDTKNGPFSQYIFEAISMLYTAWHWMSRAGWV